MSDDAKITLDPSHAGKSVSREDLVRQSETIGRIRLGKSSSYISDLRKVNLSSDDLEQMATMICNPISK